MKLTMFTLCAIGVFYESGRFEKRYDSACFIYLMSLSHSESLL